jgi:selenocysteine-specific elongation factor
MIVGTAGHIDHGKTTLVRALTGVDTDRLPEEKTRGITIDLGYAFMDVRGQDSTAARIGFIDVPGHERLVHTMLAGATGIDLALLLIAADDGIMPQTQEHLAALSLLGIAHGAAVITKIDRVDAARVEEVCGRTTQLLAPTALAGAPVMTVSSHTGQGIEALKTWLQAAALSHVRHDNGKQAFRLAVDRSFSLDGVGTVATGTVHRGTVCIGDELMVVPHGQPISVRVRSLHAQNQSVARACAGQRCAVGLAGIARDALVRGQWLVAPAVALQTQRLDARVQLWQAEARPLRSGTPVHVHIGAASMQGTVVVLSEGDALSAGAHADVQLMLHSPCAAWRGDRVVLRDASASRTIAGGIVLDPCALARYRRTAQRLQQLQALGLDDAAARRAALLAASPLGLDLQWVSRMAGEHAIPAQLEGWDIAPVHAQKLQAAALTALEQYHQQHPDEAGPDAARLRRMCAPRVAGPLWQTLLQEWVAQGCVSRSGASIHLPSHAVRLSEVETRIAQKCLPLMQAAGFEGAWVRDLARDTGEPEPVLRVTLARIAKRGDAHQVVKDLFYTEHNAQRLAALVRQVAVQQGDVTAAAFRDATQLGRKRAIQVLEYFDRIGLLRRLGDVHRVRLDTQLFKDVPL